MVRGTPVYGSLHELVEAVVGLLVDLCVKIVPGRCDRHSPCHTVARRPSAASQARTFVRTSLHTGSIYQLLAEK